MTMSRRDTIIIAVLINAGLLAVLFSTAMKIDDDNISNRPEIAETMSQGYNRSYEPLQVASSQGTVGGDEVDNVLSLYNAQKNGGKESQEITEISFGAHEGSSQVDFIEESMVSDSVQMHRTQPGVDIKEKHLNYVDITVKRGDFLDKIARANGTTVDELMRINRLANDRIDIGQVLKVPTVATPKSSEASKNPSTTSTASPAKKIESKPVVSSDSLYYIIKSGDNPWKIARQYHVKFEDLLKLNGLNEEKARNLKVGDKIRVK